MISYADALAVYRECFSRFPRDTQVLKALAAAVDGAELFTYDTAAHLTADSSLPDHDPEIAERILERTLALLDGT